MASVLVEKKLLAQAGTDVSVLLNNPFASDDSLYSAIV